MNSLFLIAKRGLPILAFFVLAYCPVRGRDLIIVAGQSNAVGFDAYGSEFTPTAKDKEILFWWRVGDPPPDRYDVTSAGQWSYLQPQPKGIPMVLNSPEEKKKHPRQYGNFAKPDGGFGPEVALARDLLKSQKKPLAVFKVAFSGTSVAEDWDPDQPDSSISCYQALFTEFRAAMNAAKAGGETLEPRAFVWVQGESDATAAFVEAYEKNLSNLLSKLRKELQKPDLPALIGVNTRFGNGKNPHMPKIILAQKSLAEKDPHTVYVDTEGAETLPPNHTHFTARGTLEVGSRFAKALLKLEEKDKMN